MFISIPKKQFEYKVNTFISVKIFLLSYSLLQSTLSELSCQVTCVKKKLKNRVSCFRSLQFDWLANMR